VGPRLEALVGGATILVVLSVGVLASIDARTARTDHMGPALIQALEEGWRPGADPREVKPIHSCHMCRDCCEKCNVKDECCCKHSDKCPCPPKDPTRR
jgi:hypothetical protein